MLLTLYTFLATRPWLRRGLLLSLTAVLVVSAARLTYKEDIADFLPLGTDARRHLALYQDISGAGDLYVIFHGRNADTLIAQVDSFQERFHAPRAQLTATLDPEALAAVQSAVYRSAPYLLTAADYARADSLLATPGYVAARLDTTRTTLLDDYSDLHTTAATHDPLALFAPLTQRLASASPAARFAIVDAHLFTPDTTRAIAIVRSPYASTESDGNAALLVAVKAAAPTATVVGGPQIAADNAAQIKRDSLVAGTLAALLIIALLWAELRSVRSIAVIALAVVWGALAALGLLACFKTTVSLIVLGIASIIVGIAVNYPLHLAAHLRHQPDMRSTLREIASPLLIGNITTVGAFLALVPLQATALSDLGLFAALMLAATILFVLVFMPHMVRPVPPREGERSLLLPLASVNIAAKRPVVVVVVVLTLVLAAAAPFTHFDDNLAAVGYTTPEARAELDYFSRLATPDTANVYYLPHTAATLDDATPDRCTVPFLRSPHDRRQALRQWYAFRERHPELRHLPLAQAGLTADAVAPFDTIVGQPPRYDITPLLHTLLRPYVVSRGDSVTVVERVARPQHGAFNVRQINAAMARTISDNFNYIGIACSAIVFLFLWLSFRSLRLAAIAFAPMAVSWIWILGAMTLLGISFNIVSIILATFIFGQGDDYTIFIVEGCRWERRHGQTMLPQYRTSILLSALIMFIGIGSLAFARHPALASLAHLTIIGMASVVLMAWLLPPLLYNRFINE